MGAVGQGLAQRSEEGQGVCQGRIAQLNGDRWGEIQGGALAHLADQHATPAIEKTRQDPAGFEGLAVQSPLQELGIDPGPAGPGGASGSEPGGPGFGQGA